MEQLNENEIKERTCILCKQTSVETNSLENNNSNNNKKKQKCSECKKIIIGNNWCQTCNSMKFQQNFNNWTSGNEIINKFIQNSQLSAKNHFQLLEWIPYEKFRNISYATEGKFGKVYSANWKDGYITYWNKKKNQWKRDGKTTVALKTLNNSQNITLEFINQVMLHLKIQEYKLSDQIIKCHGITRDPKTKDYIIVMNYVKIGNLPNFLTKKKKKLYKQHKLHENNLNMSLQLWRYKIMILQRISAGLKRTHSRKLILRDFHIEDTVCNNCITDMRLCKPENHKKFENVENNMYDVLLNLAPEILRGQECTQFSDIYSFGITMYEMISEFTLYNNNNAHGLCLVLDICEELKSEINIKVPQLLLNLIKNCLDVNPLDRPNANDLLNFFDKWLKELNRYIKGIENQAEATKTELIKQIEEIEKVKNINENPSPDNISDKDYSDNSSNDSEDNDFEECAIHD
ncbi:kinase-like protein [Rhizophagus irregularis]|uniref:Kinase-like protein n=1 Tax=Rhizophagus irregularis TaxID=588596 RepID=A0A2N0REQ9_9GLOM|nr:kinase-like protein [Rhizophagus irregularis]PKC61795.1 kinase-like protein [Rhizophagus irregularis]